MAKVLLIFPPYSLKETFGNLSEVGNMLPPLGIAYIGAALEKAGHEVKIIDAPPLRWGIKEVVAETKKFKPDLIGISASTVSYNRAVKLAQSLKKSVKASLVLGGPHVTACPREVMKQGYFNFGVIGEGEETTVELAGVLEKGKDPKKIKGLIYKKGRKIIQTEPRFYLEDLNKLPFPARHLMPDFKLYHPTPATYKKFPVGTMITSRGCPNRCTFCFRGVFGNRWRYRSPESVVSEIEELVNTYKVGEIRIWDDTFNVDQKRVIAICKLILKRKIKVSWTCLGRVNSVSLKMLRAMKAAGCWQISYGIESGNEDILIRIQKGITKAMVRRAINLTQKAGLQSLGFFILGLPGDTKTTMNETIQFAKELPLSVANFTITTPYPGTEIWFEAERRGLLKGLSYDDLMVNLPKKLYYVPEGLDRETLQAFEKKAYKEFYRNPKFILRQLRQIDSPVDLFRKIQAYFTIQSV
jgi:anaerobic magnesium-protoporphyrin IX monomethyl ester cyclase